MKCGDCEIFLAEGEVSAAVEEHLRECAECRGLLGELRANAPVLESLRHEELPGLAVKTPRRGRWHVWVAPVAAAAMFALALLAPWNARVTPPVVASPPAPALPATPEIAKAEPDPLRHQEPMKIKMLTPDPDVVIYWLMDN